MRKLVDGINIDTSDPTNYPKGRVKDKNGGGAGTIINETIFGDLKNAEAEADRINRIYGYLD